MTLVERVARELERLTPTDGTCLVAVSGGPDSLALLDLLHLGAPIHRRAIVVGHVDHGVHPASAGVADDVARAAGARGLPYAAAVHALGAACSETRAREVRRRALRGLARTHDATAIVLAHHADDQAETVLLRLLRGSGPAGLAAMAPRRGPWVRPLLGVRREELADHLASRGIAAWTDPANEDPRHLRSWVRQVVLPTVAAKLPDVVARLGDAQRQAARARAAWEEVPELIPELEFEASPGSISVAAPPLRGYRSPLREALLGAVGRRLGVALGARRLAAITALLASGPGSRRIRVARRLEVELAFDRLTFHQAVGPSFPPGVVSGAGVVDAGSQRLTFTSVPHAGEVERAGWSTVLAPGRYVVRPWRRGDRIRPLGGTGSRAVATLLREARVPPHRRSGWPVVVTADNATIVWVPGICRSDAMIPQRGAEGLHADCTDA